MHLPPRATAHAHHRRLLVGGQSLCRVARAYVEIVQVPGRELVPSQRNLILCFYAVESDERCSRFNAYHSLHPDCASQYSYHAVKCATTEKWERHSCQKRCRCGIVASERVRQRFR